MKKIMLSNHGHILLQASMDKLHSVLYVGRDAYQQVKARQKDLVTIANHFGEDVIADPYGITYSSSLMSGWSSTYRMAIRAHGLLYEILFISTSVEAVNEYCENNAGAAVIDTDNYGRIYVASIDHSG